MVPGNSIHFFYEVENIAVTLIKNSLEVFSVVIVGAKLHQPGVVPRLAGNFKIRFGLVEFGDSYAFGQGLVEFFFSSSLFGVAKVWVFVDLS